MNFKLFLVFTMYSSSLIASTVDLKPTKSSKFDIGGFSLYLERYENDKPNLIIEQRFGR